MKAIRIHKHGKSDVLTYDNLDIPVPQAGEILIKVKAVALNHLDLFVRNGIPGITLPVIMGSDASGEVVKTGENVSWFKKGDAVIHVPFRVNADDPLIKTNNENLSKSYKIVGEHLNGVQAEYICVPEIYALHKPQNLNWAEAAAFPLVALTAYHMLYRKVNINSEDWILVYGASSGVGSMAVQMAKERGAKVITTAGSQEKEKKARALGADFIINYSKEPVGKTAKEISGGGVDIVFEHTGKQTWKDSLRCLKTGGKIVICGATTGANVNIDLRALFARQQQIIGSTMGTFKDMIEVADMISMGKIKPVIDKVFDFSRIRQAHERLESGKQFGKVVLKLED